MILARRYGESGPGLFVLHGGPAAAGELAPLARKLADDFRITEPWQRGSGDEPLTVARHVEDLQALIEHDTSGEPPPALLGHSWGALLALCHAARHPEWTGPVICVGCGTFDSLARSRLQAILSDRMDAALRARLAVPLEDARARFVRDVRLTRPLYDHAPVDDGLGDIDLEAFDLAAFDETWSDWQRLVANGVYPAAFAAITSAVVILHGADDPHPGRLIRDGLARHIGQLTYVELPRCGHSPWRERFARESFFDHVRRTLRPQAEAGAPSR